MRINGTGSAVFTAKKMLKVEKAVLKFYKYC